MTLVNVSTDDTSKKEKVNALLKDALERERHILNQALETTKANLASLEAKYSEHSEEFYRRYSAGKTDDREDFVDWAGEYQIYRSLLEKAAYLQEVEVCK
jgi:flagellar motility protein MotE (MotC chaperone)